MMHTTTHANCIILMPKRQAGMNGRGNTSTYTPGQYSQHYFLRKLMFKTNEPEGLFLAGFTSLV
jgi:hypothetical protein